MTRKQDHLAFIALATFAVVAQVRLSTLPDASARARNVAPVCEAHGAASVSAVTACGGRDGRTGWQGFAGSSQQFPQGDAQAARRRLAKALWV
jgi:hypothetical protein